MNAELQKLRRHYEGLLPHAKALATSQSLMKAIQIAEQLQESLKVSRELCEEIMASEAALKRELSRITKDGE